MRKVIYLAIAALLCSSCFQITLNGGKHVIRGKGPVITKSFDFKDFDAICVKGIADIQFTQADTWEVTLKTQENIFEHLDYKVEDGVLFIQEKDRLRINVKVYDLTIQAPDLKRIEVNGVGDFDIPKGLHTDGNLEIEINGVGDFDCNDLVCNDLDVQINGVGDACVSGKAETASLKVFGVGDIDARGLIVAGNVNTRKSGVGAIRLP